MSIPLDRLYQYIENVASEVYNDYVIIYRFFPHGSKKITDLSASKKLRAPVAMGADLPIYCYDQEPLNFEMYQNVKSALADIPGLYEFAKDRVDFYKNFMKHYSIYDRPILLHSEKNSPEVRKYVKNNLCVPVYYWCHALIARDWFRYAEQVDLHTTYIDKRFLIYNRAWRGSREYRLKFADLLIDHNLVKDSKISVSFVCDNVHYKDHQFQNNNFTPSNCLEDYFEQNTTTPCYSADFDEYDYRTTGIEIVLETLFDDTRHHLTEKVLRPIACNKPFILVSTPGALAYLRGYGFKTFDNIIDESYDSIQDPMARLNAIITVMKDIQSWSNETFTKNLKEMQKIADYNKQRFFSKEFENSVTNELKQNLKNGIQEAELTNTSYEFIERPKTLLKYQPFKDVLFSEQLPAPNGGVFKKSDLMIMLKKARSYYNRYYNK